MSGLLVNQAGPGCSEGIQMFFKCYVLVIGLYLSSLYMVTSMFCFLLV